MTGIPSRSRHGLPDSPRRSWRPAVVTTAAVAFALVGAVAAPTALAATTSAAATPQRIGPNPTAPHGAVSVAAPADSTPLHLDVALAPRDQAALAGFVTAVSTPGSPEYKQYLQQGQFAARFGPTQATIDNVTAQLRAAGLHPGQVSEDGLTIPVTTTVAQAKAALGTSFTGYRLTDGRTAYSNTVAPELPSTVASSVTGIVGLSNVAQYTAAHTTPHGALATPTTAGGVRPHVTPASATPSTCSDLTGVLNDNDLVDTRDYWEPASLSANNAFGNTQLYGGYGNTGTGVTVGLFELENFDSSDIADYQSCYGTKAAVSTVKIDGGPSAAPSEATNTGLESALDIEIVAGFAPSSAIKVYQGPDYQVASDANVLDVYQRMVTDDAVQVISTSWGTCQAGLHASDPGMFTSEGNVFAAAAAQGQTVVAASGDSGSTDCYGDGSSLGSVVNVDDPADQPNVTAAGGTRMTGTAPTVQSAWNTPADSQSAGSATGGGVSAYTTLSGTANYQSGVQGPGYSNTCGAAAGTTCRQVPDVAALADAVVGFLTSYGHSAPNQQDWFIIGGTSAAAPMWGAIAALADSSTACAANGSVGFMNPTLYANPTAMRDVTTGNNDLPDSGYTGGLYAAGTGYDLTTGLGSPKTPQVVEALCDTKAGTPGSSFVPAGPTRVLDTRSHIGVPGNSPIPANTSIKLQIEGANSVPSSDVTAVVLNVTATQSTAGGYLTLYPDGTPRPVSTNLNFSAGQTIPNMVTVPVGSDGAVDIYNLAGTTHVVADLAGYYTTDAGSLYQPVTPTRVLDTRSHVGVPTTTPVPANSSISVQLAGANGVPATGVTAVALNVTATQSTAGGYLTIYPDGTTRPVSTSLNFLAGQTIPNMVTVPVGDNGKVDFYNLAGTVHIVADLAGYYTNTGAGLKFHPSAPHRLADTRSGIGVAAGQVAPPGAKQSFGLPVTDVNGLGGNNGPLATSGALVLNVVATGSTAGGYLTVYPSNVSVPTATNLNFVANQTIPNAVLTPVNGNYIEFYNLAGTTQVIVDLFGYFSAS
jgi:subtilase family serine protease